MVALPLQFGRSDWLALAIHVWLLGLIGLIGGGWWALGRADPLLAVPGVGWTSVALIALTPGLTVMRAAAISAASAGLVSLMLMIACGMASMQIALQGVLLIGVSAVTPVVAMALRRQLCRLLPDQPFVRKAMATLAASAFGIGIANGAPLLLDRLYADRPDTDQAIVHLMTALPLSGESGSVAELLRGRAQPVPAYVWLRQHSRLFVQQDLPGRSARPGEVLLLAHPPPLGPQQLVQVDDWVRRGGAALIMADGLSSWPMPHGVGDRRNAPVTSLLGPLLTHWGLDLAAPPDLAERPAMSWDGNQRLRLFSPGRLAAQSDAAGTGEAVAHCSLRADGRIADCRVGRGRALIIADADWLGAEHWAGGGAGQGELGSARRWSAGNMVWLADRISELAERTGHDRLFEPIWLPVRP